jgi:hypothetical protein
VQEESGARTRTRPADNDSKCTARRNQNLPPPTQTCVFSFLAHGPIARRCHLIVPRQSFPKVVFPYALQWIRAYSNFLARVSILSRGSGPDQYNGLQYTTVLCRALPLLKCLFCCERRAASMPCKRLFITARPVDASHRLSRLFLKQSAIDFVVPTRRSFFIKPAQIDQPRQLLNAVLLIHSVLYKASYKL